MPKPKERKHLPAEERRSITVETVLALAAKQNPGEITTAAIAKHMHVTQGALFRHFPNKEAVWQAVMEWVAERLLNKIDKAAHLHSRSIDKLQAIFITHCEFIVAHPGVPRMLFGELQRKETTAAKQIAKTLLQKYAQRIAMIIEAGKSAEEINPIVDVSAASTLLIGSIQGLVMQSLLAGDISDIMVKAPGVFSLYRASIEKV